MYVNGLDCWTIPNAWPTRTIYTRLPSVPSTGRGLFQTDSLGPGG